MWSKNDFTHSRDQYCYYFYWRLDCKYPREGQCIIIKLTNGKPDKKETERQADS